MDDLLEVALSFIGVGRGHLEHPPPVLEHEGKIYTLVLVHLHLEAQLQLVFVIELEKMTLDFLTPFYHTRIGCFLPVLVFFQYVQELSDTYLLE